MCSMFYYKYISMHVSSNIVSYSSGGEVRVFGTSRWEWVWTVVVRARTGDAVAAR